MVSVNIKLAIAFSTIAFLLLAGTLVFHYLEGWGWVDSFYFTGVTLTTVGYGDLYPTHDVGKVFTVLISFTGVAVVFYSLSVIASDYFETQQEIISKIRAVEADGDKGKHRKSILEMLEGKEWL